MGDLDAPRFLADAMLGKLARWLRVMGYDTRYMRGEDAAIAHCARAEGRVLLTRDRVLAQRRGLTTILVESQSLPEQLAQVIAEVGGPPTQTQRRCMDCNVPLKPITVQVAAAQVPPYVAQTQETFLQCQECGKIYWKGTHWQGIVTLIDEALKNKA